MSIAAAMVLSIAIAPSVIVTVQNKAQQKRLNGLNKAGAKVAATQRKANSSCVKNATKGKDADYQGCLTADGKGKFAKAKAKTTTNETKNCTQAPGFGYTSATWNL